MSWARARLRARAVRRAGKRRARPRGEQVRRGARRRAARCGESSRAATAPTRRESGTRSRRRSTRCAAHCASDRPGSARCGRARDDAGARSARCGRNACRWSRPRRRRCRGVATGTSIDIAGTNAISDRQRDERGERCRDHEMPRRRARRSRERRRRARPAEQDQRRLGESDSSNEFDNHSAAPDRFGIITSSGSCAPDRFRCGARRARRRSTIPA